MQSVLAELDQLCKYATSGNERMRPSDACDTGTGPCGNISMTAILWH